MAVNERNISIAEVKTNMVLSRDVISDTGIVLMSENTMLNDRNIMKLKVYDIESVFIKSEDGPFEEPVEVPSSYPEPVRIRETQNFKEFERKYEKSATETKAVFLSIGSGNGVDLDQLYNITKEIMDSLRSKSDLFMYLGNLKKMDEHTYAHSINVSLLCNLFGFWMGFDQEEIINLTTAGMLHDIGKTKVSAEILNKESSLTKDEFEELKRHTIYGFRILEKEDLDERIKKTALMHHEKINGTGYPTGAKGNQIDAFARIVAIADIYDAMTSERNYRERICPFDVLKTFEQNCYGELDTEYLLLFLQNIAYTYVGSWVELSNGQIGEVVFINANHLSTPIVRVENTFYDLTMRKDIAICGMI